MGILEGRGPLWERRERCPYIASIPNKILKIPNPERRHPPKTSRIHRFTGGVGVIDGTHIITPKEHEVEKLTINFHSINIKIYFYNLLENRLNKISNLAFPTLK